MQHLFLGIDIGSTTVKIAVINNSNEVVFSNYKRHFANIQDTIVELLEDCKNILSNVTVSSTITGSGGFQIAEHLHIPFVQEVIAVTTALEYYAPQTDVAIELGGAYAKIIYLATGLDRR